MAMWKKTAVIVMCLAFLLSMTGCGGSGKESNEQNAAVKEADARFGSCQYKFTGG